MLLNQCWKVELTKQKKSPHTTIFSWNPLGRLGDLKNNDPLVSINNTVPINSTSPSTSPGVSAQSISSINFFSAIWRLVTFCLFGAWKMVPAVFRALLRLSRSASRCKRSPTCINWNKERIHRVQQCKTCRFGWLETWSKLHMCSKCHMAWIQRLEMKYSCRSTRSTQLIFTALLSLTTYMYNVL